MIVSLKILRGNFLCVFDVVQGVLFVLLQHQFLSSLDQEEKKAREKCLLLEERSKPALFSLVGINPLSGRSVISSWLYPPDGWTGR